LGGNLDGVPKPILGFLSICVKLPTPSRKDFRDLVEASVLGDEVIMDQKCGDRLPVDAQPDAREIGCIYEV